MDAFLTSAGLVAIAEIGDKTQLLALLLAARFRKPVPILLGILAATVLNHGLAAALGYGIASLVQTPWFRLIVGASFLFMGGWALVPDKAGELAQSHRAGGVFLATLMAFFMVEIGDKTQIATALLAAQFHSVATVAAGTTLGMMAADAPAVLFGEIVTRYLPLKAIRLAAAALFFIIGVLVIFTALT